MSPETQNNSPEVQEEKPYVGEAKAVIAEAAKSHEETTENFKVIEAYIDKVLHDADNGEITGSAGTYDRETLIIQWEDFLTDLDRQVEARLETNPYLYIPGKDGLRASFRLLMENPATSKNFDQLLRFQVEAYNAEQNRAELLSPENIQEMGEVELNAAGVEEPMAEARRAAASFIEETPVQAQEEVSEETELQMYERFAREGKAELQELYAQHRLVTPGSQEADELANQIANAKKDAGENAKKVAQLSGTTKWH